MFQQKGERQMGENQSNEVGERVNSQQLLAFLC